MNNDERFIRNRKYTLIALAAGFVVLVIASIILAHFASVKDKVLIKGLDECLTDIKAEDKDIVLKRIFVRVKEQNEANGKESKSSYDAVVREGSCHNEPSVDDGQEFAASNFIVDIADLQYSFRIKYNYIPKSKTTNPNSFADLGTVAAYCLDEADMIYPDFGCNNTPTSMEEPDPITMLVGKVMDGCNITYTTSGTSKSGYAIILQYKPAERIYLDGKYGEFKKQCYSKAMKYLKDAKINLDDYYFYEKE